MPAHHIYQDKLCTDILSGRLADVPPLSSKTVKIYICSNKTDFEVERRTLWSQALPELHLCCLHYGLDLQFVDVHQGHDFDHVLDSHAFERHLTELQQSSQQSRGPFFVCLLGNKYGRPPLPIYLEETEFRHIRNEAFESGKDLKLLDEWYEKDENAVPAVYRLVPITDKFPHYYSRDVEKIELRDTQISGWTSVYTKLLDLIQHGAREAFKEGLINQVHHQKQERFFLSGIEQELQKALEKSVKGCVCIMRNLDDLHRKDVLACKYTDLKANGDLDKDAKKGIERLREYVSVKLNDKNKHTFSIKWCERGVVPHLLDSHYDYLDDFNAAIVTKLKFLIEQVTKSNNSSSNLVDQNCEGTSDRLCAQISPHLYKCLELGTPFVSDGFEFEIEELRRMLTSGSCMDHSPFLLTGPYFSGRSSLLSHLACRVVPETLGKDVILIPRFCYIGKSSSLEYHLQSVTQQIKDLLDVEVDFLTNDVDKLNKSYQNLLKCLSSSSRQLVIILDSLMATPNQEALYDGLSVLECQLPPRVHIIVSFIETDNNNKTILPLSKLSKKRLNNFMNVKYRTSEQLTSFIDGKLSKCKRTLTPEQKKVLINSAASDSSLNHLSFISNQIKNCLSSTSSNFVSSVIGSNFHDSVMKLFENIEKKHGLIVVSHISRYLTLARNGLTEMEIIDLLSLNNDVLLDVYPEELPPILRFPVSFWIEIKTDLGIILGEMFEDNKELMCWSSQMVYQVCRKRYLQNPRMARDTHKHIAELFLESWIDTKPLINKSRNVQRIETGNRLICPQPLLYSETRYNMRRINEMWHHLLHAGEQESFCDYAYCNFEYMLATAHSNSMELLLDNLGNSLCRFLDANINLIMCALKLSIDVLLEDPLQLANELIGRLRQLKEFYPHTIELLVTQCMQWCDSYSLPLIVPLTAWLPDPRKPLITTLDMSDKIVHIQPTHNAQHVLCTTESDAIYMYHVPSKKLVTSFTGHAGRVECVCISHSHTFLVSGGEDGTVQLCDLFTAECNKVIREHDSAVLSVALSHNDSLLVSGSRDRSVLVYSVTEGKVLHRLREHTSSVTDVIFNTTNSILVTASLDQKMLLWYTEDMTVMNTISDGINSPIICMTLSVDNTFLLIGCESGSVHVYSFTTGTEVHELKGHKGKVSSLAVSHDCVHAVIGCQKGGVYIYNLCTTELLRILSGFHKSSIISIKISTNENMIFSASKNKVCVWNMYKEKTKEVTDDNHSGAVTAVAINTSGKLAISGGKDGILKLWNLELSVFTENLVGHNGPVTCLSLMGEEGWVLSGSADKTVKVWSISMASVITDYKQHQSAIRSLYVLADKARVMSVDEQDHLNLWVAETGQTLFSYTESIPVLAVSQNSEIVFSDSGPNSVKIWMLEDSSVVQTISHKGEITCIACTADSEHVITGSDDMSLKVWEARTGKLTQVLVEHQGAVSCVTTTQNSCSVISGSHDNNIIIWNIGTGCVEHLLDGHKGVVSVLRVTIDGSTLLSGSHDGTLRVWNLLHGNLLTLFDMHLEVEDLVMTFDASNIVVRLANNSHVPLLCLHNTPASEIKSESQVSIQMVNSVSGDCMPLPLKPHPPIIHSVPSVFPVPKAMKFRRMDSRFSVSSMPEIIQVSPIKAPVQTAIMAQERKKEKKQKAKKIQRKETKKEEKRTKSKSGICSLL